VLLYDYVQTSLIGPVVQNVTAYNAEAFADNRTKMAQRFITQANGYVITQLKLNIWTGSQNPGTYTVDLYSDNSNAVGTKVATAGTRDIATIYAQSGTLTQATFSNLNINLATNTSYWVVVESNTGVEGSGMYWGHGGSTNVTNPTSAARFNPATTPPPPDTTLSTHPPHPRLPRGCFFALSSSSLLFFSWRAGRGSARVHSPHGHPARHS